MFGAFQRMGVPMEKISETKFSLFTSPVSSSPHIEETWTLEDLHDAIVRGRWHELITAVRALAPHKTEKDRTGKRRSARAREYSRLKESTLPYAALSGTWDPHHRHADGSKHKGEPCEINGIILPSGLRLLDLDNLDKTERAHIMTELRNGALPWAAACWLSPGGDGLHLIAVLDPAPVCLTDSHQAFIAVVSDLSRRIPVASAASDRAAKNLMRPSFVSSDPDAWLADNPSPFRWLNSEATGGIARSEHGRSRDTRQPMLQQIEAVARDLVASGLDYNDWLGLMSSLKSAGLDIHTVESISSEGGGRYVPGETEKKWEDLLSSDNPAAVVNGMAKRLGSEGRVMGQPRRHQDKTRETEKAPTRAFVPPRWLEIGQWVGLNLLSPGFVYDLTTSAYWHWTDGRRWTLVSERSHIMTDVLNSNQFRLAQVLRDQGCEEAAGLVAHVRQWQTQLNVKSSPLNTGMRSVLSRELYLPPDHIIACANGVLDLRDGLLHPHTPMGPYLITAVTYGRYLPEMLENLRAIIDRRLEPALPDPRRRAYLYKALTIMLGGKGGGGERGSLLYLTGTSGGGKGNTCNVVRASAGEYAMTGNVDALFAKEDINDSLANLLERSPRIVLFHEAERLPMTKILSLTGRDEMSARGPHRATISRALGAGVIVTAVNVPQGRMDGGAKRRLAAVRFDGRATDRILTTQRRDDTTADEADALITVVLHDAVRMWKEPAAWTPLPDEAGDMDTIAATADADVVEAAIDTLTDEHIGKTMTETVKFLQMKSGDFAGERDVLNLTPRSLSTRIKARDDWKTCKHSSGGVQAARLYRPMGCPCDD